MAPSAGSIRYALRQFWSSRVFTATAVLTLALGIGGTTAIFTLIHEVMLRSLPVDDPATLYRIGDGDNCCVQGGPQDRWGLFSFPLFQRLTAETPEFAEVAAFQAGMGRVSVRREGIDTAPPAAHGHPAAVDAVRGRVPANWMPEIMHVLPRQVIDIVPAGAGVGVMREQYGRSLQILLAVCGLVLLIACANVANLLLVRGVGRRTQTAVRLALGASRRRLVTQALVESVLLSVIGAAVGVLVAMGAARLLLSLAFTDAPALPISTMPSLLVLGCAFALALLTGIVFGTAPAWLATRADPVDALRGAGRSTSDQASLVRRSLLVLQATVSVVLVAGATLLGRSLGELQHQDFGFELPNASSPR